MADSDKVSLGSISTASTTPAQTQDAPPPASTTTPSHQRSMQGQTAASFVRAAAASTGDGAVPVVTTETDAPVVNETPAAEPPARKARAKRTGVKPAASLESVDGEEKKPRKNSNKWILERLTETTARVDKLTKGMVDRINSASVAGWRRRGVGRCWRGR
ncbi:hypothetical protein B0H16DRAFT_1498114 [Mycena metata]|uniref:Uncharacterized protein n=1 Tax=Mycena metata TaxID=1033252 RepID=A0AAD7NUA8_9AGAR|nr:hypothetical protein B0H16DRAFT_1506207 [Mycena metata]KAJ7781360.1 hypothetical protein B0H16DRAFT_1498114 [Mycena metata]